MIKDRGNIKWTALLLTEHRDALRKLIDEDKEREKPELDEQEIEGIGWVIQEALRENQSVKVKYHKDKRFHELEGLIEAANRVLVVINDQEIFLSDIVDIKLK